MKKKIAAFLLAVVMAVTALPLEAFAYGGTSGSQYGESNPQVGDAGTTDVAGYRISVQFANLDYGKIPANYSIKNYSISDSNKSKSFEDLSTKSLQNLYSRCLPSGDNRAAYFFTGSKEDIYVYLGNSFDKEYEVSANAKVKFKSNATSTLNDGGMFNKWFNSDIGVEYTYNDIEKFATEYISVKKETAYLNYIEQLCIADDGFMDSSDVQEFFYPSDTSNKTLANAQTLFHMLVLCKILGTGTSDIKAYVDAVNAQKTITKVPIILIESLVSYKDTNEKVHCWTLAQWIAKVKSWGDADAVKNLYTPTKLGSIKGSGSEYLESFTYLTDFLNPLTTKQPTTKYFDSAIANTLAWASYGIICDSNDAGHTYGIGAGTKNHTAKGCWRRSKVGWSQKVMSSNQSSVMVSKFDAYPGYSFYWMSSPLPVSEPAEYNAKIKAVWCDAANASNPDNGLVKITRSTKPYKVGMEAHYAVYGSDITNDSEIIKWLKSSAGKEYDYTLEVTVYNSALSLTTNGKLSIDSGTYYSSSTNWSKYKNEFKKTVTGKNKDTNGFKCTTMSASDIISFLKGESCVYFYSDRFKEVGKKTPGVYNTMANAHVSIYPSGQKDTENLYPWSYEEVETNTATIRYEVQSTTADGKYDVQADEEFSNKVYNQDGYYEYPSASDDWQTTMYVEDLGDFVSNTDGLDASEIGVVTIKLSAAAMNPLFYIPERNNGVRKSGANGLSATTGLYTTSNPKTSKAKVINSLEKELARLYNLSTQNGGITKTSTDGNAVRLTGNEAIAFRQMIIDKTRWGLTGKVIKGTWQNVDATLDMTFGISVSWTKDGGTRNYELTPKNDSVTKIYPCRPASTIKFAQNKYHVDAKPDAKVIQLQGTDRYDLGANGEKSEVTTTFTIESTSRYNSIIKSAKAYNKGDISVIITRAVGDGSDDKFFSRGDKLQLYNASTFGLKKKQEDSNEWIWDGSTPIYQVLTAFAEEDAKFIIQDTLEANTYYLSTAKPQIMFCYKVEITMDITTGATEKTTITWTPDPGQDTASWLANVDLYYNSAVDANFAEIKEGSPTKETYEAMSGVPVTANLYYATGGHEFVVNTSYQIQKFDPYREYHYEAYESACDDSWIQDGNDKCITVNDCENHTLVKSYTAGSDGTCTLTCTLSTDPQGHNDSCPEGCTDSHTHTHTTSCYTHTGGSDDTLGAEVTEYCSAGPWKKTYYALDGEAYTCSTCGASYKRAAAHTETCQGQDTGSYSVYINVSEDCQTATLKSHSWKHCICHCPKGLHQECNPHTETYKEKWTTTMKNVYYVAITECYAWRLAGNYLTINRDLLEGDDVVYSDWLPTEDDTSSNGYLYFWSADKAHLTDKTGNVLGRIHYFWHDGSHKIDGDWVVDDISLNATQAGSGFAGDINKTWSDTLYTDDDCDRPASVGGRLGHTYDQLYDCYLKYTKDDGGKGQRFGMTVVSDFLFYSANNDDVQAVFYHDYGVYSGSEKSRSNIAGTSLHDIAKFNVSDKKPGQHHTVEECVDTPTNGYKVAIDMNGSDVEISNSDYNMDATGFLWEKNSTGVGYITGGNKYIDVDDLARAGYNGMVDTRDIEDKYTPTNKSNFTYSSSRAVMEYWDDFYAEGYLRHLYKNSNTALAAYDNGNYIHYCPTDTSTGLPKSPEKQSLPLYMGMQDMDISDVAENGLYESGKVENFYECLIDYDPSRKGAIYSTDEVSWASSCNTAIETRGFTAPTTYYYGDDSADNRYVNEVVVYVPSATDVGIGISNGTSPFIDDRTNASSGNYTAINLEADGVINFPLVSEIQEIPDSSNSLAYCIKDIGKGYGGQGNLLNVVQDPHNGKQWVQRKWVMVSNYVIVDTDGDGSFADEKVYSPGEEIDLSIFDADMNYITDYAFYLPEMAYEDAATTVTYFTSTINNTSAEDPLQWEVNNVDETYNINRDIYRYHGAMNNRIFQAVGRIGNLTMVDTGDFRYSNFFKASTGEWLVPNVVYKVNDSEQVRVVIDEYDIFDKKGGGATAWNTYGSQDHKEVLNNAEPSSSYDIVSASGVRRAHYYALPLLPKYNNIDAFKDTPMRVGYAAYLDVETIGNYYNGTDYVTVQYSYYGMDKNNNLHQLDVYMLKDGKYVLINDFYNDASKITSYPVYMNWEDENERRMYTDTEDERTQKVNEQMTGTRAYNMFTKTMDKVYPYYPSGNTIYQGDYNSSILGFNSRTFIGDYYYDDVIPGFPNNNNTNVGGYMPAWKYYRNSQKWYFSNELPSSAVFVESGSACTKENIDIATSKYNKAVVTAIIRAHGDVWELKHDGSNSWARLKEAYPPTNPVDPPYPPDNPPTPTPADNPTPPTNPDPPTVITIIPIPETSRDDVTTIGTH